MNTFSGTFQALCIKTPVYRDTSERLLHECVYVTESPQNYHLKLLF